jgi:hypothetical protein
MYSDTLSHNILHTTQELKKEQKQFIEFTTYGVFIVIASAICVGMATRDLISDAMNEAFLPLIMFFGKTNMFYIAYTKLLEKTQKMSFVYVLLQKLGKLIWIILIWFLTLYLTYFIFQKLIRVDLITDKIDFISNITKYFTSDEKSLP